MIKTEGRKLLMCGIYKIISPTEKIYIGSAKNILKRCAYYKGLHCEGQIKLYNSLKKYGWENHKFEIIEECEFEKLYSLERAWGLFYNVLGADGLNLSLPGYGEVKQIMSKESIDKRILKLTGQKRTQEQKDKIGKSRVYSKKSKEEKDLDKFKRRKYISFEPIKEVRKIVLDLHTGVYYDSVTEAAMYTNNKYKKNTLSMMLSGTRTNKTNLIYA